MQFQVPQFIEIEDKIFGPLTFKQFIYIIGGGGAAFIAYKMLPAFISIFFAVGIIAFALALAFYRVNDRPFITVLESGLKYVFSSKRYTWQKPERKEPEKEVEQEAAKTIQAAISIPKTSESRLKDIAWSLDVQERSKK